MAYIEFVPERNIVLRSSRREYIFKAGTNYVLWDGRGSGGKIWYCFCKMVLARDNNQCTTCHIENTLQIHHIKPVKYFPQLYLDIDNCITLCKKCHKELHKKLKENEKMEALYIKEVNNK